MVVLSNPLALSTQGKLTFDSKKYYFYPFLSLGTKGVLSKLISQEIFEYKLCLSNTEFLKLSFFLITMSKYPCLETLDLKKVSLSGTLKTFPEVNILKSYTKVRYLERVKPSLFFPTSNKPVLNIKINTCNCT